MQVMVTLTISTLFIVLCTTANSAYVNSHCSRHYLEVKDHQIYYEVSGSGSPIILIHGGYLDHTIWDKQIEYLWIYDHNY